MPTWLRCSVKLVWPSVGCRVKKNLALSRKNHLRSGPDRGAQGRGRVCAGQRLCCNRRVSSLPRSFTRRSMAPSKCSAGTMSGWPTGGRNRCRAGYHSVCGSAAPSPAAIDSTPVLSSSGARIEGASHSSKASSLASAEALTARPRPSMAPATNGRNGCGTSAAFLAQRVCCPQAVSQQS